MGNIQHILVATDGSEYSSNAAAFAGELARALGARLSVIMVHDEQLVIPEAWKAVGLEFKDGSTPTTEDVRRQIENDAAAKHMAPTLMAIGDCQSDPEVIHTWGRPANEICDHAGENGVDMIVMGSHGRSGIKEALLGSVSHSVANMAPCAVTIVR